MSALFRWLLASAAILALDAATTPGLAARVDAHFTPPAPGQ